MDHADPNHGTYPDGTCDLCDWCPVCERVTVHDGEECVWGLDY